MTQVAERIDDEKCRVPTRLVERVWHRNDTIRITGHHGGRSVRLEVDGDVPVEAVTDFLLAAFRESTARPTPGQHR